MTNLNEAVSAFQAASAGLAQATKEQHAAEDRVIRAESQTSAAMDTYREARKALLKAAEDTDPV